MHQVAQPVEPCGVEPGEEGQGAEERIAVGRRRTRLHRGGAQALDQGLHARRVRAARRYGKAWALAEHPGQQAGPARAAADAAARTHRRGRARAHGGGGAFRSGGSCEPGVGAGLPPFAGGVSAWHAPCHRRRRGGTCRSARGPGCGRCAGRRRPDRWPSTGGWTSGLRRCGLRGTSCPRADRPRPPRPGACVRAGPAP